MACGSTTYGMGLGLGYLWASRPGVGLASQSWGGMCVCVWHRRRLATYLERAVLFHPDEVGDVHDTAASEAGIAKLTARLQGQAQVREQQQACHGKVPLKLKSQSRPHHATWPGLAGATDRAAPRGHAPAVSPAPAHGRPLCTSTTHHVASENRACWWMDRNGEGPIRAAPSTASLEHHANPPDATAAASAGQGDSLMGQAHGVSSYTDSLCSIHVRGTEGAHMATAPAEGEQALAPAAEHRGRHTPPRLHPEGPCPLWRGPVREGGRGFNGGWLGRASCRCNRKSIEVG